MNLTQNISFEDIDYTETIFCMRAITSYEIHTNKARKTTDSDNISILNAQRSLSIGIPEPVYHKPDVYDIFRITNIDIIVIISIYRA